MVHHGGHGTLLTAVAAGTPSVTFAAGAAGRDVYARRLAQLGASLHVKNPSGVTLRKAVDTLMNDGSILAASRRLAKDITASGGPDAAVDVLATKASYSTGTALH
jgi:UDP:flavonoid glycosyltransferase YjiC (YdhE family)